MAYQSSLTEIMVDMLCASSGELNQMNFDNKPFVLTPERYPIAGDAKSLKVNNIKFPLRNL